MRRHWPCLPSPRRGESLLDRLTRADPEAGHSLAAALDEALGPYDEAKVRAAERKANRRSHYYGYAEDEEDDDDEDEDDEDEDYEEILHSLDAAGSKRKRTEVVLQSVAPGPLASTAPAAASKRALPPKGLRIPAKLTGVERRNNAGSVGASSTAQPGSVIKTPSPALVSQYTSQVSSGKKSNPLLKRGQSCRA